MHDNSLLLFERYAKPFFRRGMRVLEIGTTVAGSDYRKSVGAPEQGWETLDLHPQPGVTHVARSEYDFGLPDASFDVVLSGQVIEHVRHVWTWMKELRRVVRVGGYVITLSPVSWPYHEAPVDCWRMYPEAMRSLCEWAELDLVECHHGSLEGERYRRTRPGMGQVSACRRSRLKYGVLRVLSWVGLPVEVSVDMVSIARRTG